MQHQAYALFPMQIGICQGVHLRRLSAAIACSIWAGGCTPTTQETLAVSCSEYIGKPIASRIAALGPPRTVYRIDETRLGYVFEARETRYVGGMPYYTVNYMIGADKHRTPIQPVTTVCTGVFVVRAPSDATPPSQRIIVDVIQ
jgi:hypothetical protein